MPRSSRSPAGCSPSSRVRGELVATNLPLACHLAEWAYLAAPDDDAARQCVIDVFTARADADPSLMSKGVYLRLVRTADGTYEPES